MANNDINPEVVVEVCNQVKKTLSLLNDDFSEFQSTVLSKIAESWYNENATLIMPDALSNLNKMATGISESLVSLINAIVKALKIWEESNGGQGSVATGVGYTSGAIRPLSCDVKDNKDGYKGMDTEEIAKAIAVAQEIKGTMIGRINSLKQIGNTVGFRGGSMQANLQTVCDALQSSITKTFDNVIDGITETTGVAKGNVEAAVSATESTFVIA